MKLSLISNKVVLNSVEINRMADIMLCKKDVKRKTKTPMNMVQVLAYLVTKGIVEKGQLRNITTKEISSVLGIEPKYVTRFLDSYCVRKLPSRKGGKVKYGEGLFALEYTATKTISNGKHVSDFKYNLVLTDEFYDRLEEYEGEKFDGRPSSEQIQEMISQIEKTTINTNYEKITSVTKDIVKQVKVISDNGLTIEQSVVGKEEVVVDTVNEFTFSNEKEIEELVIEEEDFNFVIDDEILNFITDEEEVEEIVEENQTFEGLNKVSNDLKDFSVKEVVITEEIASDIKKEAEIFVSNGNRNILKFVAEMTSKYPRLPEAIILYGMEQLRYDLSFMQNTNNLVRNSIMRASDKFNALNEVIKSEDGKNLIVKINRMN